MAYIGQYDNKFQINFQKQKEKMRNEKRVEVLGMGEDDQWIIDIEKIVQRIPAFIYDEDESFFVTNLIDAILFASLEEILHGVCNLSSQELPLELDFFYVLFKEEQEFIHLKKTDLYKFFKFMIVLGRSRVGDKKDLDDLNLNKYNSMVSEEDRLEKKVYYRYIKHYLKLLGNATHKR